MLLSEAKSYQKHWTYPLFELTKETGLKAKRESTARLWWKWIQGRKSDIADDRGVLEPTQCLLFGGSPEHR